MSQYDPKFDFKINVGLSDLYSQFKHFCLRPWRVFLCFNTILTNYESYDQKFDLKINVGHSDLCFTQTKWNHLMSWKYFMYKHHTFRVSFSIAWHLSLNSVWPEVWTQINVGQAYISQSSDFLPYTLKNIWCINIILSDYESVRPKLTIFK